MNILITGASGFLAKVLLRYWPRQLEDNFVLLSRQKPPAALPQNCKWLHYEKQPDLEQIKTSRPELIIHLAAASSPAYCQLHPEESRDATVSFSLFIKQLAEETASHVIFTSTDWIFDGNEAVTPFKETDTPDPSCCYSIHKKEAEEIFLADSEVSVTVLRLTLVYGEPEAERGTISWVVRKLRAGEPISLFVDEFRTPLYTKDFAAIVAHLSRYPACGLFHCGGNERFQRAEMGKELASVFGFNSTLIVPCLRHDFEGPVRRPEDLSLNSEKLYSLLPFKVHSYREALHEMALEIRG